MHTFNLDEYLGLPEGHVESYRVYMDRYLFEPLARTAARPWGLRRENTHFPEVGADYDALIARHGGLDVSHLARMCFCLLTMRRSSCSASA